MASIPAVGVDPVVTIKVLYQGLTHRTKMHLRDMVPGALEPKVREFLDISDDAVVFMERYSDSGAGYVLLQEDSAPVYKQLYRAAKAKSKLKLRVNVQGEKLEPKPVTVEDEPEMSSPNTNSVATPNPDAKAEATPAQAQTSETTLPIRASKPTSASSRSEFENRLQSLMERNSGFADHLAQQQKQLRAILSYASDTTPLPVPQSPATATTTAPAPAATAAPLATACPAGPGFAVCCNHCEKPMPGAHYHCSTCDDGDFDLCIPCVERGLSCYSDEHWLIKRSITDGHIITSTTEKVAPKSKGKQESPVTKAQSPIATQAWAQLGNLRTCNQCIMEMPEKEFLHCGTCPDYDLCQKCFGEGRHGHHPKHGFVAAVAGAVIPDPIQAKMAPGRNQTHYAICDGCDKYINGIRHKCLDCPDWDYCSSCVKDVGTTHAKHRFVPIYEPLTNYQTVAAAQPVHVGICCDGPLCSASKSSPSYIRGTRYKCAVCHDLDFCATCEASPALEHNKTHPLIKFRTPVRHVNVTTTGERPDGKRMPAMGDRRVSAAKASPRTPTISVNPIQTVVDVKPATAPAVARAPVFEAAKPVVKPALKLSTAPSSLVKQALAVPYSPRVLKNAEVDEEDDEQDEIDECKTPILGPAKEQEDLRAVFVRDAVVDGTILPPNHVFEQTWVLRNEGKTTWPAGCSVKFVGGDYMGHVDSAHPAGISELVSASESTICYAALAPGQEFSFTVLLRTPVRLGKIVSYWRLATPDGLKFGHRLWCDVNVRQIKAEEKSKVVASPKTAISPKSMQLPIIQPKVEPKVEVVEPNVKETVEEPAMERSTMIFPKLEKESPASSMHQDQDQDQESVVAKSEAEVEADWDVSTDEGFMTDEEYDILDASDDEYLERASR
jgi:next-to-BRCA1 protein 1